MPVRGRNKFKATSGKAKALEALLEPRVWSQHRTGDTGLVKRRIKLATQALKSTQSEGTVPNPEKMEFIAEAANWMSPRRIVFLFVRTYELDATYARHQWTDPFSDTAYSYERRRIGFENKSDALELILKDKQSWLKQHMKSPQ